MATREADTALWLHNKLCSTDELWSGNSICSQLTRERLLATKECFHNLQPHVKVKLMLAILHLPKRNVEEWRSEIEDILQMAAQDDSDQWVAIIGNILKSYPTTGDLNTEIDDHHGFFHQILADLKEAVKESPDAGVPPMECLYLNKNANLSVVGEPPPQPKHFQLKRKPKSDDLRAELLQRSSEAAMHIKKTGGASAMPFKFRSFAKNMDEGPEQTKEPGLMRGSGSASGFLKANTLSSSFSGSAIGQRQNQQRREGGIKLLEIGDVPVGRQRRRLAEAEAKKHRQMAKKEAAEARKMEEKKTAEASKMEDKEAAPAIPDYAAGLIPTVTTIAPAPVTVPATGPIYVPLPYVPASSTPRVITLPFNILSAATQQARDKFQSQYHLQLQKQAGGEKTLVHLVSTGHLANKQPTGFVPIQQKPPGLHVQQPPSTAVTGQQQQQQQQQQSTLPSNDQPQQPIIKQLPPARKPLLTLTHAQKLEVQEMFRTSNKVTRCEKAVILGFIAGSRENPTPQRGDIINILLSESKENVKQADDTFKAMICDVYFQMNFKTGEYKRIKKFRELEEEIEKTSSENVTVSI